MRLAVVIPVYSGEQTLTRLFEAIQDALEGLYSYEVVFVHDCAADNSLEVLHELRSCHPDRVRVIELTQNVGQHNAILHGFKHAQGELFITMDEDLQHSPTDIEALVKKQLTKEYDVVYANYDSSPQQNGIRNLASKAMKLLLARAIPNLNPHYSSFRVIRPEIAKAMTELSAGFAFIDGHVAWLTTHVSSMPVLHNKRTAGRSGYSMTSLLAFAFKIIITYTNYPLRILAIFSSLLSLLTLLFTAHFALERSKLPAEPPQELHDYEISAGIAVTLLLLGMGLLRLFLARVKQTGAGQDS
ncbi:glycosyltransferase family 2 protein [Rubripirellula sp.]|nr:glycosyltransferase family 2 protein [Rubripirellula sp.]MDB4621726.1 glycosyltransferase family 2 protein [Rubripirellula sp.]